MTGNILEIKRLLLDRLTDDQRKAVRSAKRRVLVVAGAGSGKTEIMARRIAWWVAVEQVPKDSVVAFTFTERAAEEMKFRIRGWITKTAPEGEDVALGGMYIGTIHGFCLAKLREHWPDEYHNLDILDEAARASLILRGFYGLLGLSGLKSAMGLGQYATIEAFTQAYDQLHEHNRFEVRLPPGDPPIHLGAEEEEWCKRAKLLTPVGNTEEADAFSPAAARYYAYLKCRHFVDFSTSQTEFVRQMGNNPPPVRNESGFPTHLVVDEVQDINPVQRQLMDLLVGRKGKLTAVGDHRQSIYGFRGAKVDIIARLWEQLKRAEDSEVVDLRENFRSTPRIVEVVNRWADTISPLRSMKTPAMRHGHLQRVDYRDSHVSMIGFDERRQEAEWIGEAIATLVPEGEAGAEHDKRDGGKRGLTYNDIAVLVRSSTDARTYMKALDAAGIPAIVRAGPDLYSQPEVLLILAALAIAGDIEEFIGSPSSGKSLPSRIQSVLGCDPHPESVLHSAAREIRSSGLAFDRDAETRLLLAAQAIHSRIVDGDAPTGAVTSQLRTPGLVAFLASRNKLRRVFPQKIYHWLLAEAEVERWDTGLGRGQTALYHLGALSALITGIETPGWTSTSDFKWQVIGLCQYGAEEGRVEPQPLMVTPDAVSISTIHGAKGLEFAAVFLADVNAKRFPSILAKRGPNLPLSGDIVGEIDVAGLADNENLDGERRLMYVALTRAERFLFVTHSGKQTSRFVRELEPIVTAEGGVVSNDPAGVLEALKYLPKEHRRDIQLVTSFSDLRYYLECPHDFYLRKVLGFAPTIDQAFGYGRGVHNLLRAVHSNPKRWATLSEDSEKLQAEIGKLVGRGLFYLRYTTGEPAENMRGKGIRVVADYVSHYARELASLEFEPERPFETLVEYDDGEGGALISGAIDIVRQDDPPRVTLIDFKSGDPDSDRHLGLDEEEMRFQVAIYAMAAKKELEYEPEKGLVRYLGAMGDGARELDVPLDPHSMAQAKGVLAETVGRIRDRSFHVGPTGTRHAQRCASCDFLGLCGMKEARSYRRIHDGNW